MNKKPIIIFGSVVVVVTIAAIVFRLMSGVTLYSDDHTKGNTSCNLLNGGLFCKVDDTIYFANPQNGGTLYSMNTDLGKIKQVISDNVSYLNGAGKYLFYTKRNDKKDIDSDTIFSFSSTGLYRMKRSSHALSTLYREPTQVACLYGNYVYYQHYDQKLGLQLYSSKIDGSEDKQLLDEACAPTAVDNDTIYYTGMGSDHSIHMMNINGSNSSVLYEGNCTGLSKQGSYLYFLDMADDYKLKRISADGGSFAETLVGEHVATYNVSPNEDVLYCQIDNGSNNGLYELNLSTLSLNPIASGNYNYFHLIDNYLFYEEFDQSKVYVLNLANYTTQELELPDGKKK